MQRLVILGLFFSFHIHAYCFVFVCFLVFCCCFCCCCFISQKDLVGYLEASLQNSISSRLRKRMVSWLQETGGGRWNQERRQQKAGEGTRRTSQATAEVGGLVGQGGNLIQSQVIGQIDGLMFFSPLWVRGEWGVHWTGEGFLTIGKCLERPGKLGCKHLLEIIGMPSNHMTSLKWRNTHHGQQMGCELRHTPTSIFSVKPPLTYSSTPFLNSLDSSQSDIHYDSQVSQVKVGSFLWLTTHKLILWLSTSLKDPLIQRKQYINLEKAKWLL